MDRIRPSVQGRHRMSGYGAFPKSAGVEGASGEEPITDTRNRRHGERRVACSGASA